MSSRRDVSPILRVLRDYCLGRKNVNPLRYRDELSARTQPPPNLPEGPHHKLYGNYYYTRDGRRIVKPEEVLVENSTVKQLEAGDKASAPVKRTPGRVYLWDV